MNTELYPNKWNTYDRYSEMLLKIGDKENAIKAYEKSLVLNPNGKFVFVEFHPVLWMFDDNY